MELRRDYILDRWVVISEDRSRRPREFKKQEKVKEGKTCYFCPGNENLTPPEISRVEKHGKWTVRVFPNKFPIVTEQGNPEAKTDNSFYTYASAYGRHEVIAETPYHNRQMSDLSEEELFTVFKVYAERIKALQSLDKTKYVVLFKNHGREAGTSIVHSHTQIMSYARVPKLVEEEVDAAKKFDGCPYCRIIESEKGSHRRCFENNAFIAFCPYASRFNYEIWVFPKKHCRNMTELNEGELKDLAGIMHKILKKLKHLGVAYNFILHYSPEGEDLHFHIEVLPRHGKWAGFEFLTGTVVNSVTPENAAEFYRE